MILRDKLIPLHGNNDEMTPIKAHVGTTTTGDTVEQQSNTYIRSLVEELRALIRPTGIAVDGRKYKWRGDTYTQVGAPIVRRKHGKDHHFTITLQRAGG